MNKERKGKNVVQPASTRLFSALLARRSHQGALSGFGGHWRQALRAPSTVHRRLVAPHAQGLASIDAPPHFSFSH